MRRALIAAGGLAVAAASLAQTPLEARTAAPQAQADAGRRDAAPADRRMASPAFNATSISPQLRLLAQGTLWRTDLSTDSSLSLRWRRGQMGLYLAIRLDGG